MENILFVIIIFVFIQRKMGFSLLVCVESYNNKVATAFRTCIENVISLSLSYLIYLFCCCCCQHCLFHWNWGVAMICLDYKWMVESYAAQYNIRNHKSQVCSRRILYCVFIRDSYFYFTWSAWKCSFCHLELQKIFRISASCWV